MTHSHQDAYQDINPVNLLGQKIQVNGETKKVRGFNGSMTDTNSELTLTFYDNTEKKMADIPIENLEEAI